MTEHEELLMLCAMVEQQKAELEAKDQLIQKQNIQIENMIQALLHARKKLFGPSTEMRKQTEGQLSLFDTAQGIAKELGVEQKKVTVRPYERKNRQPGIRAEMLAGLPTEIEEYEIPAEDTCSICGNVLNVIGKQFVRTEVEYVPAKLKVKHIVRQVAKCTVCGTPSGSNPSSHFQKAAVPAAPLPHSISTPSLLAQIMYQKFCMGIPLNRQESDWYRLGLVLPRSNMAHWCIRCSREWFEPVYWRIHEKLKLCEILHMDETRIQCNKEAGKKASSESFMWVMQSAASESLKGIFFYYASTRSGSIARELLKGFDGYLVTDAYAGYEKAEGIRRALCWSHCRRYFIESIPLDSRVKEIPGSKGAEGRGYIDLLFKIESEIRDLSYEERKEKRREASRPVLDAFWSWVKDTSVLYTTNEKLTSALTYATNQRKYLETFMEDGRLPISNNLVEANIKPFATARRAWLFADTPKGAMTNAVLYTLVQSAKANELDVYEYLKYLLEEMPNNRHLEHPEIIDRYLPWSSELPERCRLKKQIKRCLKW